MLLEQKPLIRQVTHEDRTAVSNLIHFGAYVHRHLDWRTPLNWIGHPPFEGLVIGNKLIAVLSCAPDIPGVAWIRTFACDLRNYQQKAWDLLWERVAHQLPELGIEVVAAIPIQKWFRQILENQPFERLHNIITFAWDLHPLPPEPSLTSLISIRTMNSSDLSAVYEIDKRAFDPLWQHSIELIELAFSQAKFATIIEDLSGPVGYQISTPTQYGIHLGRLAVHPRAQKMGIATAIVHDLQKKALEANLGRISVNTHDTNHRSIGLYTKAGFSKTSEIFPVFKYKI